MRKVFKVVDHHFGSSVMAGEHRLQYSLGHKTVPVIGRIYCFDNLEDAKDFQDPSEYILEGEGTPSADQRFPDTNPTLDFEIRWLLLSEQEPTFPGTVLCDDFTPERVVGNVE